MVGRSSQIWEAINDRTHQRFAIKVLLAESADDKEQIGQIKHEYEVGKGLDHPHVIRMHELNNQGKTPFLVMELYPWPNLKQRMTASGAESLVLQMPKMVRQAAEALKYLHSKGWIHRDIKPDNYLASDDGEVKLIDFALAEKPKTGIFRLFAGKAKIQGTRSYLSPEQIRGEPLDMRSDIYSFGCMLYELFTGKPPFVGVSSNELLQRHLSTPALRISANNTMVTPEFDDFVTTLLAKKPEDRPKDMVKVAATLTTMKFYKKAPSGR